MAGALLEKPWKKHNIWGFESPFGGNSTSIKN
jgi:hypothetical protein